MIWTDVDFVSTTDLLSEDPDISEAAGALEIALEGPSGTIRRGTEEAGRYLENILVSFTTYLSSNDLSANHLAAVFYTGSLPNQRRRVTLDQVVVSGRNTGYWSEIKIWTVNWILKRFYVTAANQSESDRYTKKRDYYLRRNVTEMWPSLKQSGIPIVFRPMPSPDAAQLRAPGTWAASAVAGAGTVSGDYSVAVSYVDQSIYISEDKSANGEGGPSQAQTVTLSSGNVIKADITGLNPPNGSFPQSEIARGFVVPRNATGYNVWAGVKGGTLYLQNAAPVPIATKTYTLAGDPLTSGFQMGQGQYVESFISVHDLIKRA